MFGHRDLKTGKSCAGKNPRSKHDEPVNKLMSKSVKTCLGLIASRCRCKTAMNTEGIQRCHATADFFFYSLACPRKNVAYLRETAVVLCTDSEVVTPASICNAIYNLKGHSQLCYPCDLRWCHLVFCCRFNFSLPQPVFATDLATGTGCAAHFAPVMFLVSRSYVHAQDILLASRCRWIAHPRWGLWMPSQQLLYFNQLLPTRVGTVRSCKLVFVLIMKMTMKMPKRHQCTS